jgi:hypothetical protein
MLEVTELRLQTDRELLRNRHIVAMCYLSSGEDYGLRRLEEYNAEIELRKARA